jgi:hypothetical protein
MWQIYAYIARDLIETKRHDAERERLTNRPKPRARRNSLLDRVLPNRSGG